MEKITHTVQEIDPKQASVWLEKRYKHQRPIRQSTVDRLARAMGEGTFSPVSVIMFSVVDNQLHLINGQQTLSAIVRSGVPQRLPTVFYEVPDEAEEAKLYFHIDRQRRRDFSDSVRSTGLCQTTGLTTTAIKYTAGAIRFIKGNWGTKKQYSEAVTDDELIDWIPYWSWEVNAIYNAISPCGKADRDLVLRVSAFSVALVTMRYQPQKAREFWRQVAQGDGLTKDDPRKALRELIISTRGQARKQAQEVSLARMARAAIVAWNAWYVGNYAKSLLPRIKSGPVKILGTSYNGLQGEDFLPIYPSPNIEQARQLDDDDDMQPALLSV